LNLLSAMSQRVRSSLMTIIVMLVAGALALTGLVWISIWAVAELRVPIDGWAPLLVGLVLFIPLIVIALARTLRTPAPPLARPEARAAPLSSREAQAAPLGSRGAQAAPLMHEPTPDIAATAKAFVQRSPLTAVALGTIAGLMLSRSSGVVSRLLDALDDPLQR
jgi:hypothetical protein